MLKYVFTEEDDKIWINVDAIESAYEYTDLYCPELNQWVACQEHLDDLQRWNPEIKLSMQSVNRVFLQMRSGKKYTLRGITIAELIG